MNRRQLFAAFTGLLASLFMPKRRAKHGKYVMYISAQRLNNVARNEAVRIDWLRVTAKKSNDQAR